MKFFKGFVITALILTLTVISTPAQKNQTLKNNEMVTDRLPEADVPVTETGNAELITASTYAFAALTGVAPEDMSSGTTVLLAAGLDDTASAVTALPFTFRFDGVNHTQFSVNANGLLSLGAVVVNNGATGRTNDFATTTNNPKMSAYWDDLCTQAAIGRVHFKTIGSPGSRKFIVEWQNMVQFNNTTVACGTTTLGTFQLWLFEGTGAVQFVSSGVGVNDNGNAGYSVGIGSSSTSFGSVTTAANTVSYAASSNANVAALASGNSYTFTPAVPAAPTAMTFTAVTQVSMTVNWTDNAMGESGYIIQRSTDGVNYTQIGTPAADATSFPDSGLTPGTTYFYRVFAVSEGAQSANLDGSQATGAPGNVSSTGSGGLWSSPATWAGGVVPGGGDSVTILDGTTVTIDTAAVALSVRVGTPAPPRGGKGASPEGANAVLRFDSAAAQSLTVGGDVFIDVSDVLSSATTGTVTTHNLSVGGNLTNEGILDLSTNGDTAGANLTFTGATNKTFGGNGSITDIRTITMNKGVTGVSVLDVTVTNFTVQGSTTDSAASAYLTLTNGTFKISGTFTGSHRTFATAAYTIPASAGFWLNNNSYTVVAQTGNATINGTLRLHGGQYNVGTAIDNSVAWGATAIVEMTGGVHTVAGRFGVGAAANTFSYTQTGGDLTVCSVGSTSTTLACFDLGTSASVNAIYSISAGKVTIQNRSTAASGPRDYRLQSGPAGSGTVNVPGGLLQFGNAASLTAGTFTAAGVMPNVVIDGTFPGNGVSLGGPVGWNNLTRDLTIPVGGTFNIGSNVFLHNGASLINNGTLTANGAAARFIFFNATGGTTYSGSGVTTGTTTSWETQTLGLTMNNTNNIVVRRIIVFVGDIINANKITLGAGDAVVNPVQFGNTSAGAATAAGVFIGTPTFNLGAGGQSVSYLRTTTARSTGPEINPGRSLIALTYDNNDPATDTLTIAGGDLTVTAAMTLSNGEIVTGANKITHNGAVTRTLGFINGTLNRSYTATGAYTYHVGTGNYSPVAATVSTLTTNPSQLSVTSADGPLAGLDPANSVAHKWTLAEVGDLTANLTFTYANGDVVGDENTYLLWRDATQIVGATMTPASNTAAATGVTDFNGTWGIGAVGVATPGDISGTVRTSGGLPIRNIIVVLTGGSLPQPLFYQTGMFGIYQFPDLPAGSYTVTLNSKRFSFPASPAAVVVNGDVTQDFTAEPGLGVRPGTKK